MCGDAAHCEGGLPRRRALRGAPGRHVRRGGRAAAAVGRAPGVRGGGLWRGCERAGPHARLGRRRARRPGAAAHARRQPRVRLGAAVSACCGGRGRCRFCCDRSGTSVRQPCSAHTPADFVVQVEAQVLRAVCLSLGWRSTRDLGLAAAAARSGGQRAPLITRFAWPAVQGAHAGGGGAAGGAARRARPARARAAGRGPRRERGHAAAQPRHPRAAAGPRAAAAPGARGRSRAGRRAARRRAVLCGARGAGGREVVRGCSRCLLRVASWAS